MGCGEPGDRTRRALRPSLASNQVARPAARSPEAARDSSAGSEGRRIELRDLSISRVSNPVAHHAARPPAKVSGADGNRTRPIPIDSQTATPVALGSRCRLLGPAAEGRRIELPARGRPRVRAGLGTIPRYPPRLRRCDAPGGNRTLHLALIGRVHRPLCYRGHTSATGETRTHDGHWLTASRSAS